MDSTAWTLQCGLCLVDSTLRILPYGLCSLDPTVCASQSGIYNPDPTNVDATVWTLHCEESKSRLNISKCTAQ